MGPRRSRDIRFERVADRLVRTVTLADGTSYTHRCPRDTFQTVAHAVQESGRAGITGAQIAQAEDLPYTPVYVALAFMLERGCVVTSLRRSFPASDVVFEDAMTEFEALVS